MTDETENTVILATGECASQTRRATFVHYELKPQHVKLHQSHHGSLSGNQQTITHWIWQKSSSWGFQEQVRPENDFPSSTHRDFDPQADSLTWHFNRFTDPEVPQRTDVGFLWLCWYFKHVLWYYRSSI